MRYLIPVLATAVLLSSTSSSADLGDQLFKLHANDGALSDRFGRSVDISGDLAIIGAYWDDDNGINSGSAYIFITPTGQQLTKLLPNDGVADQRFGRSVAICGITAIVGAYGDNDNGTHSGSAYIFNIATGQQIAKLLPNDGAANDLFGWSVAISGTTAIISAFWDDDNGADSGSVYLFDTTTGQQTAKLISDDGAANDQFGISVGIIGNTAIVGAWLDDDNGSGSGSAYLFDTTTGQQIAKLLANDGAEGDYFGFSVAISDAGAVVGAWWDDENGIKSGSAYLFDTTTGSQIAKILPNDGAEGDQFGRYIAISGATALVGAYLDNDNGINSGSAYLFDISTPANPTQIFKLLPDDGETWDNFGGSVAISGNIAIVGAYRDNDNAAGSGSAYLFDATNSAPCPWDLNKSGSVGTGDLLELFAQWGTDGPADFDESGIVDTSDLLILFANWGPCP